MKCFIYTPKTRTCRRGYAAWTAACVAMCVVFYATYATAKSPVESVVQKLQKVEEIRVASGEILYTFRSDGSFSADPLVISGRSVSGTWMLSARHKHRIEVRGEWGWINGLSRKGDVRWMLLSIAGLSSEMEEVGYAKIKAFRARVVETKPISLVVENADGQRTVLRRPKGK